MSEKQPEQTYKIVIADALLDQMLAGVLNADQARVEYAIEVAYIEETGGIAY